MLRVHIDDGRLLLHPFSGLCRAVGQPDLHRNVTAFRKDLFEDPHKLRRLVLCYHRILDLHGQKILLIKREDGPAEHIV